MERRLAAILVADVVGYTRLMGADEAGTLRRVTELRQQVLEPLIAAHRGRVRAGRGPDFSTLPRHGFAYDGARTLTNHGAP